MSESESVRFGSKSDVEWESWDAFRELLPNTTCI